MKVPLSLLVAIFVIACEKKPSEEELEQKRIIETTHNQPTPKPGDWMYKNFKNPLDPPKK